MKTTIELPKHVSRQLEVAAINGDNLGEDAKTALVTEVLKAFKAESAVQSPPKDLPVLVKLLLWGIVPAALLIGLEQYLYHQDVQQWIRRIVDHLGTAFLVATLVGVGIDRLFHHEHLGKMADSITSCMHESERRLADEVIPHALEKMTGGHSLEFLSDNESIYRLVSAKMEEFPCFTNTIITQVIREPSTNRIDYYRRKAALMNKGRLSCREVVSLKAIPLVEEQVVKHVTEAKRVSNFSMGIVELPDTMGTFINFAIFQRKFDDYDEGFLMLGWFSDNLSKMHRHTCIATNHPALIKLFANYFAILERSARPYVPATK